MSMFNNIAVNQALATLDHSSQQYKVLNHLVMRGNISQLEARKLYGVERLTSRIHELRKTIAIRPERKRDLTGKLYVRYHLAMA